MPSGQSPVLWVGFVLFFPRMFLEDLAMLEDGGRGSGCIGSAVLAAWSSSCACLTLSSHDSVRPRDKPPSMSLDECNF